MAQQDTSTKKKKTHSPAGIILLIILLLLAGTVGFLYYSAVKAPVEMDDPWQMAASAPMSAGTRFRFSAEDGTAQIKIDAADLWNLILTYAGPDFLDVVNGELSSYGLSVSGCAIRMEKEELRLDLELFWKNTRLLVKVPCDLNVTGQRFSLVPTGVKLGVIPLPVDALLNKVKLEYDLKLPAISQVTQVRLEQDAIFLTGSLEQDIRELAPLDKNLYQTAVFCESVQPLADALQTKEGFSAILAHLEGNPGSVEDLYRDLFTMAPPEKTEQYLDSRLGLTQRFFSGIDFSAVAEAQAAVNEQRRDLAISLEQLLTNISGDFSDKKFRLSDGVFYIYGQPFHAAQYGAGKHDALFGVLDPDSFFLVLVDARDGYIRSTPSFFRIADENQQFTRSIDFNRTYIPGLVLRSVDGEPFLLYEAEVREDDFYFRNIVLCPLTQEDAEQLQVPGKFGVWTN